MKQEGVNESPHKSLDFFFMYIKFFRNYGEDKKDEAKENLPTQLSVELEGERGKQTEGKTNWYRVGCLFLTLICLILLVVIIILSMKLENGSSAWQAAAAGGGDKSSVACTKAQCRASFPLDRPQRHGCLHCADGWQAFGKTCYYLSTSRLNWAESKTNCSARGGSLAVINSMSLQNFLTDEGKLTYWIGLKRSGSEWRWVDSSALQDSYWQDSQPLGDCGLLRSEGPHQSNWISSPCNYMSYFICELQPGSPIQ